jgi:hypothetical protein
MDKILSRICTRPMGSAWPDDAPLPEVSAMSDVGVWHNPDAGLDSKALNNPSRFAATFCINLEYDKTSWLSKIIVALICAVLFRMMIIDVTFWITQKVQTAGSGVIAS